MTILGDSQKEKSVGGIGEKKKEIGRG